MSILANKTETKARRILAKCLPYFYEVHDLNMTAEDAFDVRQAQINLRRIIDGNQDDPLTVNAYPVTKDHLYVLVIWPEVQELTGYTWFRKECSLCQAFSEQQYFNSAYFVPLKRIIELT